MEAAYGELTDSSISETTMMIPKPDSIYFTPLALFHGNALYVTTTSLLMGCTVALSKRFSAGKFWEEVTKSKATIFNTIGAIIPILMKQPRSPI
jgi:crotonobetaine/carnitine-CoA ligase